jgi:hypothetical protein
MQTEYRQTIGGGIAPHRALSRPVLAVDPGNRFTKWVDCQTVQSIPSYVKELADWEEGGHDAQSFEIGFSGHRYLVGRLAQLMGGSPAFESGKADLAHLLVLPALASDSQERIERLVIPTPDSRNQVVIAKLKELETTIKFSVNGHDCLTTIRSVSAVDECRGAFDLALGRGMWRYPNNPNGVLDIGGGTAIARKESERWRFAPGRGHSATGHISLGATISSGHPSQSWQHSGRGHDYGQHRHRGLSVRQHRNRFLAGVRSSSRRLG